MWVSATDGLRGDGRAAGGPLRLHTVELATLDVFGLFLAIAAYVALARLRWPLLLTLAVSATAGLVYFLVTNRAAL